MVNICTALKIFIEMIFINCFCLFPYHISFDCLVSQV